jgi:flagellar motor protein MotB
MQLKRNSKVPEPEGPNVPAYIVTFSDMVTLLLTFFVMLLSLANTQDPELVDKGRESFLKSTSTMGLGALFGRESGPEFKNIKIKHAASITEASENLRVIDAEEEITRRLFKKVASKMTTMPSQLTSEKTDFMVTDIKFDPGKAQLNAQDRLFLDEFYKNVQTRIENGSIKLYVLGLAPDAQTEKEQFFLSARRAGNVAAHIKHLIGKKPTRIVYSWGAGKGGAWVNGKSPVSSKSQILIAALHMSK